MGSCLPEITACGDLLYYGTVQRMVQFQYYFGLGVFLWERGTGSGALFWGTGERWWPVAELWLLGPSFYF